MVDNGLHLRISTGTAERLYALWTKALAETSALGNEPITDDADFLTQVSLIWLILHEIAHGELGHFAFTGDVGISETDAPRSRGLVSRVSETSDAPIAGFDGIERLQAEHCLELQADHEAGEYILEAWSPDEWNSLRVRSAMHHGGDDPDREGGRGQRCCRTDAPEGRNEDIPVARPSGDVVDGACAD